MLELEIARQVPGPVYSTRTVSLILGRTIYMGRCFFQLVVYSPPILQAIQDFNCRVNIFKGNFVRLLLYDAVRSRVEKILFWSGGKL